MGGLQILHHILIDFYLKLFTLSVYNIYFKPNSKDFLFIKRVHFELASTESIFLHPLDTNS